MHGNSCSQIASLLWQTLHDYSISFQSEHSYDWVHEEMDLVGGQAVGPWSYKWATADWDSEARVT